MTQLYADLVSNVHWVRSRWRFRRLVEGMAMVAAVGLAVLMLATIVDQLGHVSRAGRVLLALCFWCPTIVVAWRSILRPLLAPHSDDYFAALLEQRIPALTSRFINALQLGREPDPPCPKIVDAIVADAVEAIDQVDPTRAVASAATPRRLLAAVGAAVVFVGYLIVAGPGAQAALLRVLLPTADIRPYTHTQIQLGHDQTVTVLEGEPLTITASAEGRIPQHADLHWLDPQQRRRQVRMQTHDKAFSYTFAAVSHPFRYYLAAGDARSSVVDVLVEPRPRIESMSVTYQYPSYAQLPDRHVEAFEGHLHALAQTRAVLSIHTNKPLAELRTADATAADLAESAFEADTTGQVWSAGLTIAEPGVFRLHMLDQLGYEVVAANTFTVTIDADAPPIIRFTAPGRDIQLRPDQAMTWQIAAADDYGLGGVQLLGKLNAAEQPALLDTWPLDQAGPQRQTELALTQTMAQLNLRGGDRLEYWAVAFDRNDITGPGRAQTRKFNVVVLTEEQATLVSGRQLSDYAKVVAELIRQQRRNRAETAAYSAAPPLIERQSLIRRHTLRLADLMQKNAFPGLSIIKDLNELAAGPMASAVGGLESYRDERQLEVAKTLADQTLETQDQIIEALESILARLNRNEHMRNLLKKMKKKDPVEHKEVTAQLEKLADDLDKFLLDVKDLNEKYEKIAKRKVDELSSEQLKVLEEAEHRLDRWKKWSKDTVDDIAKLPEGFVKDSHLKDDINTIFEEIEKKQRGKTQEIATPLEEGAMALAQTVAEDVEIWMPDAGDSLRWVMEEPLGGKFEVPPYMLPDSLQDMVGDLIEDMEEFDEMADDMTSSWGGNMPVGWDVMDGPISVFSAQGKTGNQLPNESEITGRSGGGRRGRSSGQMVGSESRALEGRPTPARLTKEPYEEGNVDARKQLNPRGATGGGKKTGGGARGLQGGTPPDFVRNMQRMAKNQKQLREKMQRVAQAFQLAGKSPWRLDRAINLVAQAEQDMRDRRYEDGARKHRAALSDMRAVASGIDEAISLSLDKARHVPPELRKQITAGSQQALPDGYEELVGAYYKALSEAGEGPSGDQ